MKYSERSNNMEIGIRCEEAISKQDCDCPKSSEDNYHNQTNKKMENVMCNIPYPQICVSAKNPRYASMITKAYAGCVSETTAVMQYVYQDTVLKKRYPDLAETLSYIARVEMKHMDMLGELICALGGDPRYHNTSDNSCAYWNATSVDYSKTPRMILLCDIEAEKKAIAEYKRLIKVICDENVDAVLKRIIMDEERHIEILRDCLAVYSQPQEKYAYDMGFRRY